MATSFGVEGVGVGGGVGDIDDDVLMQFGIPPNAFAVRPRIQSVRPFFSTAPLSTRCFHS